MLKTIVLIAVFCGIVMAAYFLRDAVAGVFEPPYRQPVLAFCGLIVLVLLFVVLWAILQSVGVTMPW